MELRRGHISGSYYKECHFYVERYYIPFFGHLSVRDLREGHLEDFRNQLPEHLSLKTVRNILGILHKLLSDAYRRKDIIVLPAFPTISPKEPITRWLTREEQDAVLSQMEDPVRRTFYLLLIRQGCRPNEARALKWDKVDFKNNRIIIAAGFNRDTFKEYTKEKEIRYLHMHSEVREALLKLPRSLSGWVFTYRGKPLSIWLVSNYWRRAALKAGIKISCYEGTRHSFGSQKAIEGHSLYHLQFTMGHKTLSSTQRYAKLSAEISQRVIEGICPQTVPKGYNENGKL